MAQQAGWDMFSQWCDSVTQLLDVSFYIAPISIQLGSVPAIAKLFNIYIGPRGIGPTHSYHLD